MLLDSLIINMGPCLAKRKISEYVNIYSDIEKTIQNNDLADFFHISQSEAFKASFLDINSNYFRVDDIFLNLLSLSAYHSSFDVFKYVHSELKASLEAADLNLQKQGKSLIELICTRSNSEFLDYYLPFYIPHSAEVHSEEHSDTINLTKASEKSKIKSQKSRSASTAIQKACEQGNLNIISYVYKYFKEKPAVPTQLDINYQDENTGENCALVACRKVNYVMIKYLHLSCKCNFRVLNKQGENAIQILAASNKKLPVKTFHECFVYLVNLTGVDFIYNYEETVLLLNCQKTITFFENKLRSKGIEIDKTLVEEKNKIVKVDYVKSLVEQKIDSFEGLDYNFCTMYEEIMASDDELSDIGPESRNGTPFASVFGDV